MLSSEYLDEATELAYEAGWTDGLPVIPPTRQRVQRFLDYVKRAPDELIGEIPPLGGRATVEKVAANAVMAGCKPEYLPVVIAAIEALLQEPFNLRAIQCTTHVATPLIIVNGPIVKQLGLNYGNNCFGQGNRANATIGRAVRLVLTNIGGATPGEVDKATFGHPGKYTYCVAEHEEANPWQPLHVERGFAPSDSVVTVHPAEAPHNFINVGADNPRDLLITIAKSMAIPCTNTIHKTGDVFLVFSPDHARVIARAGWSKNDVRQFLFEKARLPVRDLTVGNLYWRDMASNNLWPAWIDRDNPDQLVPVVGRPEEFQIMVAGGPGGHTLFIPGWGRAYATSARVNA